MKLNRRHPYAIVGAVLVTAGAAAGVAYADKREPAEDAQPITQAAVSMVQAVQTAELRASGKARRAEYESSKRGWVYEVEVVSGARVFDVTVSATDGTVLSTEEDKADRDGHDGHDDDKD